jgi:uncharacterized protein with HEPN domain/predicted nucleotidyltransferase
MAENPAVEVDETNPIDAKLQALSELCRRFGVRRLDLFGSAAAGRFDPTRSDLDFLVEFEPGPQGRSYFALREALELLFQRRVDLLAEAALDNPYLRRRIETERRRLFPIAMMSNQAATLLWDAQRAAERISRFTAGRSYDEYLNDDMLRAAVERQFEIIGEALAGLRCIDPTLAAQLPEVQQIIAFRNILIHGYAAIDDRIVWDVIQDDLPGLRAALTKLLGSGTTPGP